MDGRSGTDGRPARATSTGSATPTDLSDRIDERDLAGGLNRRALLRNVGSVASALALTQVLGVDRILGPADGPVTVETALVHAGPDRIDGTPDTLERRTRTVPADWHARVSAALDLHARLVRTRVPGYLNSAVVPGSYDEGTARISIGVRAGGRRSVPQTVEELVSRLDVDWRGIFGGIDVSVEEADSLESTETDRADRDRYLAPDASIDPVPGGVRCEAGRAIATLTPAIYHPDRSEPLFGTALHAFRDAEPFRGTAIGLPTADGTAQTIGYALDPLYDSDVAVASPTGGRTPGSVVGRWSELPIRGQLTHWGLADRVARGTDLLKIGGTTGSTTGAIHGIDAATCITTDRCRVGQLTWGTEIDIADGDSGSVTVDPEPAGLDGALVASVNSARTWWPGQNHVWGISAHALTSSHGYHF